MITIAAGRITQAAAVEALFETKPPVLVEVRFPRMATAPDWYFCQERHELDAVLDRLGPGVELHLHSVWELENTGTPVVMAKS